MNKRIHASMAGLVGILVCADVVSAGPVNLDFESGTLSGWTVSGMTSLATNTNAAWIQGDSSSKGQWSAAQGTRFALLRSGGGINMPTRMSQQFSAQAQETLAFNVFFDTADYAPYNDQAWVRLTNLSNNSTTDLFKADVLSVGNFGETPWTLVTHKFSLAGLYKLEVGVVNRVDNKRVSQIGFDSVVVTPLPASAWMGLAGLVGLAALRKRPR
jgi:hypothetical protein